MSAPTMDLMLRRLVVLAGDLHDLLARGDWEQAMPAQDAFDESFSMLVRMTETGHAFDSAHANDLARLRHVHAENVRLAEDLKRTAGVELGRATNVHRINAAYSPLGMNHRPSPRYVDGSA